MVYQMERWAGKTNRAGLGSERCEAWVGLSHCALAEWGYLPHNSWRVSGIVHTLALAAAEEPHPALLTVQLHVHLLAWPSW